MVDMLILYFIIGFIGASVGSFVNLFSQRYGEQAVVLGRSHCDHCSKTLNFIDLIPILSWLFNGGRCRYCREGLSKRHVLIELIFLVMFVVVFQAAYPLVSLKRLFFFTILLTCTVTDLDKGMIYNNVLITGVIGLAIFHIADGSLVIMSIHLLITFAAGMLIYTLFNNYIGGGDLKLLAYIAFYTGIFGACIILFFSSIVGLLIYGLLFLVTQSKIRDQAIPFAPLLLVGSSIYIYLSDAVFNWYIRLLGW